MKKTTTTTLGQRISISIFVLFALFIIGSIFALLLSNDVEELNANTAVITISGPISSDSAESVFSSGGASSTEIVRELYKARDDASIKAVILEINSPGGSAVASDEIGQAIKEVRAANKTVVAWIREVGASGGYWVASASDHIVANRMSITGSIGVIGSYMEFDAFIADWNVSYNRLVAGERKDIGDPFVNLGDENKAFMQHKLNRIHAFFIQEIATNRNMSLQQITQLADGQFYLGIEAYEAGLVDELGGKNEAIAYIEKQKNIDVALVAYEPEKGFLGELFGVFSQQKPTVAQQTLTQTMNTKIPVPQLQ